MIRIMFFILLLIVSYNYLIAPQGRCLDAGEGLLIQGTGLSLPFLRLNLNASQALCDPPYAFSTAPSLRKM